MVLGVEIGVAGASGGARCFDQGAAKLFGALAGAAGAAACRRTRCCRDRHRPRRRDARRSGTRSCRPQPVRRSGPRRRGARPRGSCRAGRSPLRTGAICSSNAPERRSLASSRKSIGRGSARRRARVRRPSDPQALRAAPAAPCGARAPARRGPSDLVVPGTSASSMARPLLPSRSASHAVELDGGVFRTCLTCHALTNVQAKRPSTTAPPASHKHPWPPWRAA